MTSAYKIPVPQPTTKVTPLQRRSAPNRLSTSPARPPRSSEPVVPLQPPPAWLRLLVVLQRGSNVAAFVLAIAALGAYASTAYFQNRWSDTHQKLENLRQQERQLSAYQESLKNQVIRSAQTDSASLALPKPDRVAFVKPAPERSLQNDMPAASLPLPVRKTPLSY